MASKKKKASAAKKQSDAVKKQSKKNELESTKSEDKESAKLAEIEADLKREKSEAEKLKEDEHSLEIRRAIEDHLDRNRLQKELDYLFDEDFPKDDEKDSDE